MRWPGLLKCGKGVPSQRRACSHSSWGSQLRMAAMRIPMQCTPAGPPEKQNKLPVHWTSGREAFKSSLQAGAQRLQHCYNVSSHKLTPAGAFQFNNLKLIHTQAGKPRGRGGTGSAATALPTLAGRHSRVTDLTGGGGGGGGHTFRTLLINARRLTHQVHDYRKSALELWVGAAYSGPKAVPRNAPASWVTRSCPGQAQLDSQARTTILGHTAAARRQRTSSQPAGPDWEALDWVPGHRTL